MATNREKLAKMTNEELAAFFEESSACDRCAFKETECGECYQGTLQWLEQESEE